MASLCLLNTLCVIIIAFLINVNVGAPSNRHPSSLHNNQTNEPIPTSQDLNQKLEIELDTFYKKQSPCSDGAQSPETENQ